jgi:gp16 family phage-associated protein
MKRTSAPPLPPRVPYPQTPETAHQWLVDHGVAVTELARQHQVPRSTLVDLLRGKQKGRYGQAHRGAIVLGLKPEPDNQRAAA